jgi:putative heme-binding domain-containing protein
MFPQSLHGALFVADWAKGQIVAYRLKRKDSTYQATAEVFVRGNPLNATDLAVGPDGWLYFSTGGRGTEGGIYRLVWNGRVPPGVADPGAGITAAVRQPQFESAWARQRIARIRLVHGRQWKDTLVALARRPDAKVEQRLRALDLLQLFGPPPERHVLVSLTKDAQPAIRAKATYLLGIHADAAVSPVFTQLVHDADPFVRRTAVESMVRSGMEPSLGTLVVPLVSADRHLASSSRRALARVTADKWEPGVLGSRDPRVFLEGATAVLTCRPEQETARNVVERGRKMMEQFLPDREFIDLLRVFQLVVLRGDLPEEELAPLGAALAEEYPSKSDAINRELVRLLVRLQARGAADRMFEQLDAPLPLPEKIHLAMHLPRLKHEWTSQQKLAIMKFYEQARQSPGGPSIGRYLEKAAVELAATFNEAEQAELLKVGSEMQTGALAVLGYLKLPLSDERLQSMIVIDRRLADAKGEANDRLKVGIVAVLARSGQPEAMAYLRELFAAQIERRVAVAMGLAQAPDGENWPLLVESLPILEGFAAKEVLTRLAQVDRKPEEPEAVRQVILKGLKLRETGARQAIALLEHWTGEKQEADAEAWETSLAKWQAWFREKYPQHPEAVLPAESAAGKWKLTDLLAYLGSPEATKASPARGQHVFTTAQCAKCHRHGELGEAVGPDLSTVARRFQKKEILESILYPSHVISTQFASKVVRTVDGQVIGGLVAEQPDGGVTILTPTAEKVTLTAEQIDQIAPSSVSAMPEGLLNDLSQEQIADLMAYLFAAPGASVTQDPARTTTK